MPRKSLRSGKESDKASTELIFPAKYLYEWSAAAGSAFSDEIAGPRISDEIIDFKPGAEPLDPFAAAYSLASPVGRRKRGWRGKSIGAEPLDPFAAAYSPATPVGYIISGAEPPSPKLRMNGRGVLFPAVRR